MYERRSPKAKGRTSNKSKKTPTILTEEDVFDRLKSVLIVGNSQ